MPDSKNKRTYEQDTLLIPGLHLESSSPARTTTRASVNTSSRYDDQERADREKLVNKLIDHLKDL
jgi:hypothetical protein